MAKATLTLPNGTVVKVDGSTAEIQELLDLYGQRGTGSPGAARPLGKGGGPSKRQMTPPRARKPAQQQRGEGEQRELTEIVNLVKNSDEAEEIERHILDRSSQVDRTLLPLYIIHEHLDDAFGLSSGDISRITRELGVPVSTPNASTTLAATAAKYVIGDRVRKKGQPVKYKLSRRGLQYMQSVITGKSSENKG